MKIALVGQPNCGKSTIFNYIAGYKAITSNFPGTTVKYTKTKTHIDGYTCDCIDLPGTYSLTSEDLAELEARNFILSGEVDVLINVADASLLSRSLELTIQLLELEVPMLLCLNMMDEALRKGIQIHAQKLSYILGIPVIPTIGKTGKGVRDLFNVAIKVFEMKMKGKTLYFRKDIEEIIEQMAPLVSDLSLAERLPARFLSIKLLENDPFFVNEIENESDAINQIKALQKKLTQTHGTDPEEVISSERHALAMNIFERVATVIHPPERDIRTVVDRWVMHSFWGYLILLIVFYGLFNFVFGIGSYLEDSLLKSLDRYLKDFLEQWRQKSLGYFLVQGIFQGVGGGVAIVIPYLVPFLIGLSVLEDIGYLPRVAFLMDIFMHRIGLHGKSIIPFILGYGCSVPAVMATRILELPQHRFIVSVMVTMIPCAARITIIFGLVAFYISPNAALAIFALNIFIVAIIGRILSSFFPELANIGLILEIPAYQLPIIKNVLKKSWFRIREFIIIAWPILIVSSTALALMEYAGLEKYINYFLSPLTGLLGLPPIVGTTLIFGLLRKELSLIMLSQALGTVNVSTILSPAQIIVFTIFVTFYMPCLATIAALWKEIGKKGVLWALIISLLVAIFLSLGARIFMGFF
ncbi:MAG: ferrous iron transport protein B [Thermodesulfobacteriota bacterium]